MENATAVRSQERLSGRDGDADAHPVAVAGRVRTAPQGRSRFPFLPEPSRNRAVRYTNGWVDPATRAIYLGDDRGCIHHFSAELDPIASSPPTTHGVAVFGMCGTERDLFTRDMAGNVVRWCRRTLAPLEFISTQHFAAPDNPPAPSPSNAIEIVEDELWVCNARGSVSVFEIGDTLSFRRELHRSPPAFSERLHALADGSMVLCDVSGRIWKTEPDRENFAPFFAVGAGVVHSIASDPRHSRYWMTSDICGSVILIDRDGQLVDQVRITADDVEELVFSADGEECFVACFDHYIHVLHNGERPAETGLIGPFKFQLSHLKSAGPNLLAILESGEAYLIDGATHDVVMSQGGTDCIWNVELAGNRLLCPTEGGRLVVLGISLDAETGALRLEPSGDSGPLGYGRIRKALGLDDGSIVVGTTSGCLARLRADGTPLWEHELGGIIRDISIDPDQVHIAACTETGLLVEVRIEDGAETGRFANDRPIWCLLHRGPRSLLFGERRMVDDIRALREDLSRLAAYDFSSGRCETLLRARGNFKRLMHAGGDRILIASNTEHFVFLFDLGRRTIVRSFKDWIINTPENACIVESKLFVVTYSQQIMQYDLDSGAVESVEFSAEGYPKVICPIGTDSKSLLVAGRNFISQYAIGREGPELVRTFYLDGLMHGPSVDRTAGEGRGTMS